MSPSDEIKKMNALFKMFDVDGEVGKGKSSLGDPIYHSFPYFIRYRDDFCIHKVNLRTLEEVLQFGHDVIAKAQSNA